MCNYICNDINIYIYIYINISIICIHTIIKNRCAHASFCLKRDRERESQHPNIKYPFNI